MQQDTTMSEKINKTVTTLATMLDYLGLHADIKGEEKDGKILVKVSSDDAGRIIGRRGQALTSLQFLINRMMLKFDNAFPRIVVDVDGYSRTKTSSSNRRTTATQRSARRRTTTLARRRTMTKRSSDLKEKQSREERNKQLVQQALDAAKEVKRWGDSVTLPPMNAHERRVIHTTLKDDPEIITESIETDNPRLKRVVVKLASTSSGENKPSDTTPQQQS